VTAAQKSLWQNLRHRLRKATAKAGAKSALAKEFGVSRATVSQWLSGVIAPAAENTLRLLEWVTVEEAKSQQKKTAARASTRLRRKTRKEKSKTNEKPKSSPT